MKPLKPTKLTLFVIVIIVSLGYSQSPESKNETPKYLESFYWWQTAVSKKPYSWYTSKEGLKVAKNILSWQYNGTGWPLMNTAYLPFEGDSTRIGKWGNKAALVKATLNEMRFLARGYKATEDQRYKKALLGGLNFILDAQYESGAWPRTYPEFKSSYSHYASFNDDVITDMMTFLNEVITLPDFKIVGEDNLERAKAAYNKGLDFILKSQIKVKGILTAWPQQCDPVTYEPKKARSFEPAAISGGESANILVFLMDIRKPSPEIINAVKAGVQWYHDVQINGIEVIKTNDDVIVKENLQASPVWARYYEIGSNKPMFSGRDGIIKTALKDIELERRKGYQWYNKSGIELFARYKDWLHERQWDNQPQTNIDESKVGDYTLPDPLVLQNGKRVKNVKQWEQKRRPELLELFKTYQHGHAPNNTVKTAFQIIEKDRLTMGDSAKRIQARITFPDVDNAPKIRVCVSVPANAKGPVPTLLHISFTPNTLLYEDEGIDEGLAWNTKMKLHIPDKEARLIRDINPKYFIKRGYGIVTVYYGDIEPDFNGGEAYGVRSMFKKEDIEKNAWGAIGAWSWGLGKVMDFLETMPQVDSKKVAVSGVSRLGKTAIWAGASDERFAMVIPIVSGEGGTSISRRNFGETVADLTNPFRYHYWYTSRYTDYAFKVNQLPVDGHMLLTLVAPRPVLQVVGLTDTWSDSTGEWVAANAAKPVYELYGLKGVGDSNKPPLETPVLNTMGFYMHDDGHTVLPRDFKIMADFMDLHFKD